MLEVLNLNENNCADCYKCIRTCSVKAITYANNTAEIVHDECILCGNCFVACPQKAKQVRCDVPRVKEAIAAGKHVVCSLAPSFIADFRIRSLDVMADALKRLGFAEVQETAVGAQMVSDEYARIMREGKQRVLISSCCPSINMLIQKYYPTMLPHLAKVLTPMQAHCKAIKEQNPEAFTVFIGPCIAKKAEADDSPYTDVALTYDGQLDVLGGQPVAQLVIGLRQNQIRQIRRLRHRPVQRLHDQTDRIFYVSLYRCRKFITLSTASAEPLKAAPPK